MGALSRDSYSPFYPLIFWHSVRSVLSWLEQVALDCARGKGILIDEKLNTARQNPDTAALMRSSALSGLGFRVRDRETSSVVGLCIKSYPNF